MANSEEVFILERTEVVLHPYPGANYIVLHVLYKAADLPPALVQIDKRKYSPALVAAVVQADIQLRRKQLAGGSIAP